MKTAKSLCFHLAQLPSQFGRGAGVQRSARADRQPVNASDALQNQQSDTKEKGAIYGILELGFVCTESQPEYHSRPYCPDSAAGSIYIWFPLLTVPLRYLSPPPNTERSHWLIWPTPSTTSMEPADTFSLPVKIYVPTRLAINHRTRSVGSLVRYNAKAQADSLQWLRFLPVNPTHMTD